jgi:hypothetical protein
VVTALRTSVDRLPFAELADALEAVEEACELVDQAANGSSQGEFHQIVDWFRQVADGIDELQRKLSAIQRDVTDMANRLEAISPSGELLVSSPPTSGAPPGNDLLAKLPERVGGKTSGIWVDEEGREHTLVSGEHDWQQARNLLAELRIGPARGALWVAAHVEVKLAALLRHTTARHVTLAINNAPCDDGRWSCDRLLPRVLRPGQTVTIHWPAGTQTYRGKEA